MPAGFGYGAIGTMVRNTLKDGASAMGRGASVMYGKHAASGTWRTAMTGDAMRMGGQAYRGMSRMSNPALSATMGGIAGSTYGAFSEDTSILGGALAGAGLGVGLMHTARAGATYSRLRGAGVGMTRKEAATRTANAFASQTNRYIGRTLSTASNKITSTLKASRNVMDGVNIPDWMKM